MKNSIKVSQNEIHTLVSTHWYGFFPSVSNGSAIYIKNEGDEHSTCIINLHRFREDIKKVQSASKGRMPNIVELKSINDIIQAIISSITSTNSKWIICEGTSDKYYLDHYLKNKDIKTVSVGGSKYVKKAFEHFYLALEEQRDSILGKIFFLLDTDKNFEFYPTKASILNFSLKRI